MLTIKKCNTVKVIHKLKVDNDIIEVGSILALAKGGKNPHFAYYYNGKMKAFYFKATNEVLKKYFEDVVVNSKMEKELEPITFKNYKEFPTMDGAAMSADVYFNGKKFGFIENSGYGGPTSFFGYGLEKNEKTLKDVIKIIDEIRGEVYGSEGEGDKLEVLLQYKLTYSYLFISFSEQAKEERESLEKFLKE